MPDRVVAVVDMGSNSLKLTVARRGPDGGIESIARATETVRLGMGVRESGELAPDRIEAALEALHRFARIARKHSAAQTVGVATEAVRSARNGAAFLERVRAETGWEVRAISGEEEAALTFRGLALGTDLAGPVVVADIGGGSTEIIVATDGEIGYVRSFALGSGALTEDHVPTDPPPEAELTVCSQVAGEMVRGVPFPEAGAARLIATGGTGEYLGRLAGRERGIGPDGLEMALAICRGEPSESLADMLGIAPARARVLPAGIAIVRGIAGLLTPTEVQTAASGIRDGLLVELLAISR